MVLSSPKSWIISSSLVLLFSVLRVTQSKLGEIARNTPLDACARLCSEEALCKYMAAFNSVCLITMDTNHPFFNRVPFIYKTYYSVRDLQNIPEENTNKPLYQFVFDKTGSFRLSYSPSRGILFSTTGDERFHLTIHYRGRCGTDWLRCHDLKVYCTADAKTFRMSPRSMRSGTSGLQRTDVYDNCQTFELRPSMVTPCTVPVTDNCTVYVNLTKDSLTTTRSTHIPDSTSSIIPDSTSTVSSQFPYSTASVSSHIPDSTSAGSTPFPNSSSGLPPDPDLVTTSPLLSFLFGNGGYSSSMLPSNTDSTTKPPGSRYLSGGPIAAISSGVFGVVVLIALVLMTICRYRRRGRKSSQHRISSSKLEDIRLSRCQLNKRYLFAMNNGLDTAVLETSEDDPSYLP